MFASKPKLRAPWYRVIRHPTADEWGQYEIVDGNGKLNQTEHDVGGQSRQRRT